MERNYYDATLLSLSDSEAVYQWQGQEMRRPRGKSSTWLDQDIGKVGVLVVNESSGEAGYFRAYLEQRLRRVIEADTARDWCWCVKHEDGTETTLYVKPGIIPGKDGAVIYDETEPVTINVPPEFFDLCAEYKLNAEEVLRGFIADACGLMNFQAEPREDRYSSNGSDERSMAADYLERAYAVLRAA